MSKQFQSPNHFGVKEYIESEGRQIPIITVSGTYYDMGRWYGNLYAAEIKESVEHFFHTISHMGVRHGYDHQLEQDFFSNEELLSIMHQLNQHVPQDFFDENQGILDGCEEAGYPIEDRKTFELIYAIVELGERECTMFAAHSPATTGHTYQLRNLDYYIDMGFHDMPVITIRIPQNENGEEIENPYASFGYACHSGIITGINRYGVTLSQIRANFTNASTLNGMPLFCLIQEILRKCRSAADAEKLLKNTMRPTSHYIIVSDPLQKEDSLKLIFSDPEYIISANANEEIDVSVIKDENMRFYKPMEGIVYWREMEGPADGGWVQVGSKEVFEQLKEVTGKIDHNVSIDISKKNGTDHAITTAIFDSTAKEVWLAFAMGETPAHKTPYIHIPLEKYFSYRRG